MKFQKISFFVLSLLTLTVNWRLIQNKSKMVMKTVRAMQTFCLYDIYTKISK